MAIAQDGNNNIIPIAFAIVESETLEAWSFFLTNVRGISNQNMTYAWFLIDTNPLKVQLDVVIADDNIHKHIQFTASDTLQQTL